MSDGDPLSTSHGRHRQGHEVKHNVLFYFSTNNIENKAPSFREWVSGK